MFQSYPLLFVCNVVLLIYMLRDGQHKQDVWVQVADYWTNIFWTKLNILDQERNMRYMQYVDNHL